ncbi:MAG: hypothetical protein KDD62_00800 [Bdellovibrionales bacterium]|nr:hypothetical protein [Bdellovibrionales bacterium]
MLDQSPILKQVVQQVRGQVEPFLAQQDRWHDIQHVGRVVEFAKQINQIEGADPFLIEVGAWLHQLHDPNLHKLKPILDGLRISATQRENLYEIVEQCRPNIISDQSSHEARVVFDADAGDLMRPAGILREALCNYGDRSQSPFDAISGARSVQLLFVDKLQTEGGRQLFAARIQDANNFWESLQRDEETLSDILRLSPKPW